MKLNKIITLLLTFLLIQSCSKDDLAELNVDPNTSPSALPNQLLTAGMGYFGIALDGYMNEDNAILAQYWAGGPGVNIIDLERYAVEPGDYNTEWRYSYEQALTDLKFAIDNGNGAQAVAAEILSIAIFQYLVDLYGDIPYSEALQGANGILTPSYDNDEDIYPLLLERLDNALAKIGTEDVLGSEDIIYGGDLGQWEKFANSLKLRMLMRQSTVKDVSVAVQNLISEGNFITTAADIAKIPFNGGTGNLNPQYARREQGVGQFYVASNTIVTVMDMLGDPRLDVIFDPAVNTGTVVGMIQGNVNDLITPSKDDFSFPSGVAYGTNNDVLLLTHWEVAFLLAEAEAKFGTANKAKAMYDQAISDHFSYIGAGSASAYLSTDASYPTTGDLQTQLSAIGVQKWISMNGLQETEGWIESRRFDLPNARIFTNGIFVTPTRTVLGAGIFPSIRLYPQNEIDYNPNTPARSLTDKVFWDN
ncbi:MAG: SusD/RagB family nutrient-binding outer membrane lipoprotein [Chitinophagales bacterium]|nr:SusD/RagB family nutrient-binding outer membrane lipoprotein [Bacteroidota bacterium]MCB9043980.1 SusD/RagB family nutrient-binding outer membrane lipoprotein [Chitinophagales bacterium]